MLKKMHKIVMFGPRPATSIDLPFEDKDLGYIARAAAHSPALVDRVQKPIT